MLSYLLKNNMGSLIMFYQIKVLAVSLKNLKENG